MEHRCGQRYPLEVTVLVYCHGLPVFWGKTGNIGLGGAFIKTGAGAYPEGALLDIEFEIHQNTFIKHTRMAVCVIHRSSEGMGVMFKDPDCEEMADIRVLLEAA